MRFPADELRDKALLALEDAVEECRYRRPRPSYAVRFALAYLWAYSGCGDREPYDELWRAMQDEKSPWNFSAADGRLLRIYVSLGLERDPAVHRPCGNAGPNGKGTVDE
jgi:hypothetical protein